MKSHNLCDRTRLSPSRERQGSPSLFVANEKLLIILRVADASRGRDSEVSEMAEIAVPLKMLNKAPYGMIQIYLVKNSLCIIFKGVLLCFFTF